MDDKRVYLFDGKELVKCIRCRFVWGTANK